jgi:hypothetical protein
MRIHTTIIVLLVGRGKYVACLRWVLTCGESDVKKSEPATRDLSVYTGCARRSDYTRDIIYILYIYLATRYPIFN